MGVTILYVVQESMLLSHFLQWYNSLKVLNAQNILPLRKQMWPMCVWLLEMYFVRNVCVSVFPPPKKLITSGMIWIRYGWLNKCYSFYMATVVNIISRCNLRIDAYCTN